MFKQVKSAFNAGIEVLRNPKLLNRILDDNDVWKNRLNKHYPAFNEGFPDAEITEVIQSNTENLEVMDFLGGGSTPPDLILLKGVCKKIPNCKYFEIGTWRGESTVNVASVCEVCYTLNLDPNIAFNGEFKDVIGFFSKNKKNITQLYGDSMKFDFGGLNKKFDVIFIDGNHRYSYIKQDTINVFKHLIHENSIVIWHDYGINQSIPRYETISAIVDALPAEKHNNLYHVSNTIACIYSPKIKFTPPKKLAPGIPDKIFKVSFEISKI